MNRLWRSIAFILMLPLINGGIMAKRIKPANFERGFEVVVQAFDVDVSGGVFTVEGTGSPIDGIVVEIPGGALRRPVRLELGYVEGRMDLRTGRWGGVVLLVCTGRLTSFEHPVRIVVPFRDSGKAIAMAGYGIDEKGRLHLVDTLGLEPVSQTVTFLTFKPLVLTWVYV